MFNRRGPIKRLVGGAVDLTKEYQADRKERKAKEASTAAAAANSSESNALTNSGESNVPGPPGQQIAELAEHGPSVDDTIDDQWARDLDEAQQDGHSTGNEVNSDAVMQNLARRHTTLPQHPQQPLEMPVILPQRRPGSQHRGFVRAYAPMMLQCDIDQNAWMEFLDGLEASINANPWFNVVNASASVLSVVQSAVAGTSVVGMVVSMAVSAALESGRRGYMHYRQNDYLDQANEVFFKPRGLYCLIMAHKPNSGEMVAEVDLKTNFERTVENREAQSKWKSLTSASSGTTQREAEIPASAPLVFPQLDAMDDSQKANAFKRFGDSVATYFDDRAVAKFEEKNPGSKLTGQPSGTQSASTPEDQSSQVGTDGPAPKPDRQYHLDGPIARMYERGKERRAQRKQRKDKKESQRPLKRLMKEDVLYLMVANLPTQEEMDRIMAGLS